MKKHLFRRRHEEDSFSMLNTASLPDLIFTVLFFFMLVTHMRNNEVQVKYQVPQGTELQKVTHKSAVSYIYIGRVGGEEDKFAIQLNDKLATIDDIRQYVADERQRMSPDDQGRMVVTIKADRDVPMGMISDVKNALREAFALKISYSATEKQ